MRPLIAISLLTLAIPAAAHHGRDFLLVQDASVPAPFTGIVFSNFELSGHAGADEWSFEPGIVAGLGQGLSAGLTASLMDEGEGWEFSSLSPQIQWQINPASDRFRFSLLAGYQFSQGSGGEHGHDTAEVICGPEYGPDSPACEDVVPHDHGTHGHGGIHQHGVDAIFARLVAETDLGEKTKLDLNVIAVVPDGGQAEWGYALGLRHAFTHEFAIGVEALGDFSTGGYHETALAAYFSPSHTVSFKLGAGAGLTESSPDFTVHAGAVYRY